MTAVPEPMSGPLGGRFPTGALRVADMSRALDFFLDLDCEVRQAADGWALLCGGAAPFVLFRSGNVRTLTVLPRPELVRLQVRLTTSDIRALRRRIVARGAPVARIIHPCHAPAGELELVDPDGNHVLVTQSGPPAGRSSCSSGARPSGRMLGSEPGLHTRHCSEAVLRA